jgi:biotin carboxyl carrier protein
MTALQKAFISIRQKWQAGDTRRKAVKRRVLQYVDSNPLRSFYIALATLVGLIILSNIIGNIKPEEKKASEVVKEVSEFQIGTVPKIRVLAKVEKTGVISVTALTPGVVSAINMPVGSKVNRGQQVLALSSNYQGGNSSSLSRQLSEVQYNSAVSTKDLQKELIAKQREIAEKSDINADELRRITDQSVGETSELINLNDEILASLDGSIANLASQNPNDPLIISTKQLKTQFLAARNGARQGARMATYNASSTNPPAQLSDLGRDIALKQLDLQEKMIDVNIEVARLQVGIARVVEAMMFPAAPISGTVEKVNVRVGQAVNPGQELFVISGDSAKKPSRAVAYVAPRIAKNISLMEDSLMIIRAGVTVKTKPYYVTTDAVESTLHGVYFAIPPESASEVTENGYIMVEMPVGYTQTTTAAIFVPIDAVYQSKDANIIYVDDNGKAVAKTVSLGEVTGSFVEVTDGLQSGESVIVTRTVIAGDKVKRITP